MAKAKTKTTDVTDAPVPGTEDLGVEVAGRSQDVTATSTTTHVKDYVLQASQESLVDHAANEVALRQALIQQGLRATGDISHSKLKDTPSEGSTTYRYKVEAIPAGHDGTIAVEHQTVHGEVGGVDSTGESDPAVTDTK